MRQRLITMVVHTTFVTVLDARWDVVTLNVDKLITTRSVVTPVLIELIFGWDVVGPVAFEQVYTNSIILYAIDMILNNHFLCNLHFLDHVYVIGGWSLQYYHLWSFVDRVLWIRRNQLLRSPVRFLQRYIGHLQKNLIRHQNVRHMFANDDIFQLQLSH